jgi:hypothetical protein
MLLLLPLLVACKPEPEGPPTCPALDAAPVVAACFTGPGDGSDQGRATRSGEWEGFVETVGTDAWPADCAAFGGARTGGWWATLTTTEGQVVVGVDAPGVTAPLEGARMGVRGSLSPGEPDAGFLTLTDSLDHVIAFIGQSGSPIAIVPPDGWSFAYGGTECASVDGCVAGYSVAVTTDDGSTGDVDLGVTLSVGGWLFTNAVTTSPVTGGECADDPSVSRVSVVAIE